MPGKIGRAKTAIKNLEKQLASNPTEKQRVEFLRQLEHQKVVLARAEMNHAWITKRLEKLS